MSWRSPSNSPKLDLQTRETALKGGEGKARRSFPEKPRTADSIAWSSGTIEKPSMPMDGKLTTEQVSAIKEIWINRGRALGELRAGDKDLRMLLACPGTEDMPIPPEARQYWAFQKPVAAVRAGGCGGSVETRSTASVEQARQDKGIKGAPRADSITLVRRAYMDLIGLPPTPAQTPLSSWPTLRLTPGSA